MEGVPAPSAARPTEILRKSNRHLIGLAALVVAFVAAGAGWFLLKPAIIAGAGAPTPRAADQTSDGRRPTGEAAEKAPGGRSGSPFTPGVRARPRPAFRSQRLPGRALRRRALEARRLAPGDRRALGPPGLQGRQDRRPPTGRPGDHAATGGSRRCISRRPCWITRARPSRRTRVLEELRTLVESDPRWPSPPWAPRSTSRASRPCGGARTRTASCARATAPASCPSPPRPSTPSPPGSRLAIRHFTEYLDQFPDNLEVRWLLNLAHMTLAEYPDKVDPRFRLDLSGFFHSEFDIGAFREISHPAGLGDRMNQSGGAIMDDFDGDGRLDILITCHDPTQSMAFYRNAGDGTFVDRTKEAGVADQLGGLVCYQADYDNDGRLDVFIPRGAWHDWPMRPTLLHNRRRPVRGRDAAGRAARPGQLQRRGLGRLRQRRPDRPLRRLREAGQPPLPQQRGRHLRGGRREGRRQGRPGAVRQGMLLARLRQRRLPRPVRQQLHRRRPALPQRARRPLRRGHQPAWGSTAPRASPAGRSTTTTTAGSTSSPSITTARSTT